MSDDITRQIEADVRAFEEHSIRTALLRRNVIDKLNASVTEMSLDLGNMKASEIEAKMGVVNTLLKALEDSDSQKINTIKLKQKIKADETSQNAVKSISAMVAEFLRNTDIAPKITSIEKPTGAVKLDQADALLEAAATEAGVAVLDTELDFSTAEVKEIKVDG